MSASAGPSVSEARTQPLGASSIPSLSIIKPHLTAGLYYSYGLCAHQRWSDELDVRKLSLNTYIPSVGSYV